MILRPFTIDDAPIIIPAHQSQQIDRLLLFVGMMTIGQSYFIPVAWIIACIAPFAAIQEGCLIRSK